MKMESNKIMRTENQRKGDAAEEMAITEAIFWKGEHVTRMPINNPGYDFESERHGGCF